jgi:hypothetical protein
VVQVVASAAKSKRDMEVVVCCPYPFLASVAEVCNGSKVSVGAEDVFVEDKGAYTGAVAISQVHDALWFCCVSAPRLARRPRCSMRAQGGGMFFLHRRQCSAYTRLSPVLLVQHFFCCGA